MAEALEALEDGRLPCTDAHSDRRAPETEAGRGRGTGTQAGKAGERMGGWS